MFEIVREKLSAVSSTVFTRKVRAWTVDPSALLSREVCTFSICVLMPFIVCC